MFNVKKICKNTFVILTLYMFVTFMIPFHKSVAATNITVTGPSLVLEGQSAVFNVTYSSDVIYINLSSGDVVLNGFQATVSVSGSGNSRKIVLNNVRGIGSGRSITIASGTGYVGSSKISGAESNTFRIKDATVTNQVPTQQPTTPSTNNNSNNNASNNTVQTPTVNNNTNANTNTNTPNADESQNNDVQTETNNTQTEQSQEQVKEEETKVEENINYDEMIPIPNTGK